MLVKYKALPKNECCLICDGHVYVFDFRGDCILTDAGLLPKYITNTVDVTVASFITLNGVTEVLVTKDDKATSYIISNKDISEIIMTVMGKGNYIQALKQKTFVDNYAVTNYLFVYTKLQSSVVDMVLNQLGAVVKKEY